MPRRALLEPFLGPGFSEKRGYVQMVSACMQRWHLGFPPLPASFRVSIQYLVEGQVEDFGPAHIFLSVMLGQPGSAGGKTMEQQAKKKKKLTGCSFRGHHARVTGCH